MTKTRRIKAFVELRSGFISNPERDGWERLDNDLDLRLEYVRVHGMPRVSDELTGRKVSRWPEIPRDEWRCVPVPGDTIEWEAWHNNHVTERGD